MKKRISASNLPNIGLKGQVCAILEELKEKSGLNIDVNQLKALKDHLSTISEKMTRSFSQNAIMAGFEANGMIDKKTHLYPDLFKIMQTCKSTNVTKNMRI